jgi:predicted RNase H-like HicB family nuclease/uncharacterized damage-inducible protein DinB
MTCCEVCLELGPDGEAMAHIPALPGCHARGLSADQAVAALRQAALDYHDLLRRHGEDEPDPDSLDLEVVEIIPSPPPFQRGSVAALFEADRHSVRRDELEQVYLRRAGYTRLDLLALVRDLPDETLDWKTSDDAMSIREVLRHVGNAEEFYVSRIVAPETLPPEWEHDEDLPIFDFLDMERRTVFERFRALTDAELGGVFTPTHFTRNPGEPWTARKALRRLLEHEIEHTRHVHEVLALQDAGAD